MIKKFLLVAAVSAALVLTGCTTPADYFDSVTSEINSIQKATTTIENAQDTVEIAKAKSSIVDSYNKLNNLKDFRGDDTLRSLALQYAQLSVNAYCNKSRYMDLQYADSLTEADSVELNNLGKDLQSTKIMMLNHLTDVEHRFMKKYDLIQDFNY